MGLLIVILIYLLEIIFETAIIFGIGSLFIFAFSVKFTWSLFKAFVIALVIMVIRTLFKNRS